MSFTSGTISGAGPLAQLLTIIDAALTTHAAWDSVDTSGSGETGTSTWKCLGTHNLQGIDFFVTFRKSNQLYVQLHEEYNAATDVATGYAPAAAQAAATPGSDGRVLTTPPTTTLVTSGSNWNAGTYVNVNATTFTYWLSVTNDRIVLATTSSGSDAAVYVGQYERAYTAGQDPRPLIVGRMEVVSSSVTGGTFTRELDGTVVDIATSRTYPWCAYVTPYENGLGAHPLNSKDYVVEQYVAAKMAVGAANPLIANMRGWLLDVRYCYPGVTAANGDTITIDGATWTYMKYSSGATNPLIVRNAA